MKKGNKTFVWVFVIVVVAIGLLGYRSFFGGGEAEGKVPCFNSALREAMHIHPQLKIRIDGRDQLIPANIGLDLACHRLIHTHDTTGVLHVESHVVKDFTLGEFFAVWEKPFSRTQILDNIADAEHEITMTVDGQPNQEYENLILKDQQQIVIEYKGK
ncbi:MAG: hypothetical protein HY436_01615 [Candidatus Liptonbacteria bacterium]|nr:hypothetical protein [Candidatus Liptonbacteria bacterium]